jgi:hypothetical protein
MDLKAKKKNPFKKCRGKSRCIGPACEQWVELKYEDQTVGRCADAWISVLLTELRQAIDRVALAASKK